MRKILNDFACILVCVTIARISNNLNGLRLFIKLGALACVPVAGIPNDLDGLRLFCKFGSSANLLDTIART